VARAGDTEVSFRNLAPYAFPFRVINSALDRLMIINMRERQGEFDNHEFQKALAYVSAGSLSIAQSIREENLFEGLNEWWEAGQGLADPEVGYNSIQRLLSKKVQLAIPQQPSKLVQALQPERPMTDPLTVQQQFMAKAFPQSAIAPKRYDALGFDQKNPINPVWDLFGFDYSTKDSRNANFADDKHKYVAKQLAEMAGATDTSFEAPYDAAAFAGPDMGKGFQGQDLRDIKTTDGTETWWDRLNRYTWDTGAKDSLYQMLSTYKDEMPVGTWAHNGAKVTETKKMLSAFRQMAFRRLYDEEASIRQTNLDNLRYMGQIQTGAKDSPYRPFR
jgi:hypothetical protein